MRKIKNLVLILFLALLIISPQVAPVSEHVEIVEAATVKISQKKLTLAIGKAKVLKISGTKNKVTWKSSKKEVATVSNKGNVKAKTSGTATITALVANKKYTCTVTVPASDTTNKGSSAKETNIKSEFPTLQYATGNALGGIVKLSPPKDDLKPPTKIITTRKALKERIIYLNNNCSGGSYKIRVSGFSKKNDLSHINKVIFNNATIFGRINNFTYSYWKDDIDSITVNVNKTLSYELASAFADKDYINTTKNANVKKIYPIVKEILQKNIKSNMTDYEKEKVIHDYMIESYSYDTSLSIFTEEELILKKTGVCDAYADTFQIFMNLMGIECFTQSGTANGGPHKWNIILLDGDWYNVDVTWDDPIANFKLSEEIKHAYFNVTDKQLRQDHQWEQQAGISATATKYRYQ